MRRGCNPPDDALRADQDDDQLDLQSLHRVRERWVVRRTAVINQIRGMLLERGITIRKGRHHIEESLTGILEDPDSLLSGSSSDEARLSPWPEDNPLVDRQCKNNRRCK